MRILVALLLFALLALASGPNSTASAQEAISSCHAQRAGYSNYEGMRVSRFRAYARAGQTCRIAVNTWSYVTIHAVDVVVPPQNGRLLRARSNGITFKAGDRQADDRFVLRFHVVNRQGEGYIYADVDVEPRG